MILNDREKKKIMMWMIITLVLSVLMGVASIISYYYTISSNIGNSMVLVSCVFIGMYFVLFIFYIQPKTNNKCYHTNNKKYYSKN